MKDRIKKIRKELDLTQQTFADKLGVKRNTVGQWECGINPLTDQTVCSICREFNVNEEWLRTGEGEMFQALSEDEEVAKLVSDLLEDGENNAFYKIILEIMRTYNELSPNSQKILTETSAKLLENLSTKKED